MLTTNAPNLTPRTWMQAATGNKANGHIPQGRAAMVRLWIVRIAGGATNQAGKHTVQPSELNAPTVESHITMLEYAGDPNVARNSIRAGGSPLTNRTILLSQQTT